jgi:hypothetical protein
VSIRRNNYKGYSRLEEFPSNPFYVYGIVQQPVCCVPGAFDVSLCLHDSIRIDPKFVNNYVTYAFEYCLVVCDIFMDSSNFSVRRIINPQTLLKAGGTAQDE